LHHAIWILFALMTAALLAAFCARCWRRWPVRSCLVVGRRLSAQLAELEVEKSAGVWCEPRISGRAREIGRRLLKASAAPDVQAAAVPAKRMPHRCHRHHHRGPGVALSLYLAIGSPDYPDQPLASRGAEVQRARTSAT